MLKIKNYVKAESLEQAYEPVSYTHLETKIYGKLAGN